MNEPDDPRDDEREDDADEDLDAESDRAHLEATFAEEEAPPAEPAPAPTQGRLFENERTPEPEPRHYETDAQERRHEANRSQRKSGFESLLRDSLKKAVERGLEAGIGTLKSADTVVQKVVEEVKAPKDVTGYVFSQIDETKNVLIRAVAHEVREFLDATDVASELQRALTALSFEVKMEIRFIPNEAGELQPKVKAKAAPKASRRDSRRPGARRGDEDED